MEISYRTRAKPLMGRYEERIFATEAEAREYASDQLSSTRVQIIKRTVAGPAISATVNQEIIYDSLTDREDEPTTHYHVVSFINGCLNDYDSGPIETFDLAQEHLRQYIEGDYVQWKEVSSDLFTKGVYTAQIETCSEDCEDE